VVRESPDAAKVDRVSEEIRAGDSPRPHSVHRQQNRVEKRPLSAFIASAGIGRLDTERADNDFFRPGTTVASFHWPEVCRTLLRTCGHPLSQVADVLTTHASAGRSLVGILAMNPGDGATTTALCLASRLAERQRRVIMVDGNFRTPRLAKLLEAEPTAGWQDVLKHGAPLTDAVVRAADDGLDLLALGEKIPGDALRLVSGLQAVVTAGVLRHAYDHVLFDVGALNDTAPQPLLLEMMRNMGVDAAIAVTRPGRAEPRDIDALARHLSRCGCEFLGTIENRISNSRAA
jgi:Mrp family chromosome partitioning ATPase